MPSFGENLRALRLSRGYTQDKFAKAINSNQANVTAWERGTRMPSLATIAGIADTFKVPLSSLISLESSGIEDDLVREVADLLSRWYFRKLFDTVRYLPKTDVEVLLAVADAFRRKNDPSVSG